MSKVAPDPAGDAPEVTRYALGSWGRTIRLCAIRLSTAAAAVMPLLIWLNPRK